jgi:hypothetical protein
VTGYKTDTCEVTVHTVGGSGGSNLCRFSEDGSVYMRYSPFGVWNLQVDNAANLDLASVSAVRFAFGMDVQALGAAGSTNRMVFNSSQCATKAEATRCDTRSGDPCDGVQCGSHGRCDGSTGDCTCDPGYSGPECHVVCPLNCGTHGKCTGPQAQCVCEPGYYGSQCDRYDICDTLSCGAHGRCKSNVTTARTASCVCDVGFGGEHCDQRSGGAALPSIFGGVGGGQAGAAVFGIVGVVGVASLVKRRVVAVGGAGDGLLAPLATVV